MRCAASKFKYSNFIALLRASIKIFCGLLNLPLYGAVLFAGVKKSSHIDAPWLQQFDFSINAARVAREAAVRAYDAVAGMMIEISLCPTAPPTACADIFASPRAAAISRAICP